jgi:hypothetical protein
MNPIDLDKPILKIPVPEGQAEWTVRHAVEGVQIFGGIGSGKTSGSGRMIALKYLSNDFGGLVLTAKPDEKELWQEYCRETNRLDDLLIIEPNGNFKFNFLEYESSHSEFGKAITDNIVEVLKTVIQAGNEKDSGRSDDAFWENALDMLIFNVIDLCRLAYGTLSVQHMYEIVQSLPKYAPETTKNEDNESKKTLNERKKTLTAFDKAYKLANDKVKSQGQAWYNSLSYAEKLALENEDVHYETLFESIPDARLMKYVHEFFIDTFKNLSSKTRSIVEFTFSGFLFRLLRDPVYSLFCKHKSNISPEDSLKGKIILINLPVKVYHKVGRDCQILFKYIWQRSMERRKVTASSKPVFLWADEAQNFIHEHDAEYQATARSSQISTVYITQNIPNYYASMGGHHAEYRVKSFLGTLATKIFHANADIETNKYASELIGDDYFEEKTKNITYAENFSKSENFSYVLEKQVRAEEFVSLKTGGPKNNNRVEGYIHRQGDAIFGNYNFCKTNFSQVRKPSFNQSI